MIAAWILTLPWTQIESLSKKYQINPKIVGAVVMQESAGNACASRYEMDYKWLFKPEIYAGINKITRITETNQQKTSWGLMQIMGAVAREHGYNGPLVSLCDIEVNLEYGIKHLISLKKRFGENISDVLAAYNAGSPRRNESGDYVNQYYVNKVLKYIEELN